MGSEQYCLRWNNHQANLLRVCAQLLRDERLVDVTLACADEGRCIRAHKVVLSACSAYFRALFDDYPARHPIVILKDVRFAELRTLVEFMYKGEVSVEYAQLSQLLKTAESLKVKGLAEMTREYKPEPPEQTEPEELVSRRPAPPSPDASEPTQTRDSPIVPTPPCKSPDRIMTEPAALKRAPSENGSPEPPGNNFGPPLPITHQQPVICRSSSPPNCEPLPGPSNMPPVQQVPLSLKKEVDWGGGMDDKNSGESSSDYSRLPHDSPILDVERSESSPSVIERPSSTASSRASTPAGAFLPFPLQGLLEAGLVPPSLLTEDAFRCAACLAGFPSLWLLEQHAALQHMPGAPSGPGLSPDKPFVCDQCGQSYRYRSAYVKHREQNHRARLPADKLFSCDVCGMQFRYLKSFKKHRLNHALERLHGKSGEGISRKTDTIQQSPDQGNDQVSSSNETLVADEGTPKIVKKEVDDIEEPQGCEGGTSSDAERTEAEQDDTIDSRVGLPAATGNLLRRTTGDAGMLSTLMRTDNADTSDRQRERRFACPFCGKCVRSKENLKLHVRKHTAFNGTFQHYQT
ncbi:protein bric-a-brac 1-like isoform X2 [Cylas formicarius]|uniref:protein bric-a-brac 1-like isoform X2 n=1 Tax=Cylas formicarius TaxID=197179 RepID=UPI0029584B78|nr:protein bric-a-brac 1-like isoform X2 [Cylas formicarius]